MAALSAIVRDEPYLIAHKYFYNVDSRFIHFNIITRLVSFIAVKPNEGFHRQLDQDWMQYIRIGSRLLVLYIQMICFIMMSVSTCTGCILFLSLVTGLQLQIWQWRYHLVGKIMTSSSPNLGLLIARDVRLWYAMLCDNWRDTAQLLQRSRTSKKGCCKRICEG